MTDAPRDELEPCPFCGERLILDRDDNGEYWWHQNHRASDCWLNTACVANRNDGEDGIAAWNRRHCAPSAPREWRDIKDAPKDGVEFQAWVGHWEPRCRFNPDTDAFEIWGRTDYDQDGWDVYTYLKPTRFMPLPEPPQ